MDGQGQYRLFHSAQLPSPSQLHLPPPSPYRTHTLPPISTRYPPPTFPQHPSLQSPPLPSPVSAWQHPRSGGLSPQNLRERERERDVLPLPRHRRDSSTDVKPHPREHHLPPPQPPSQQHQAMPHPIEHPSAQPEDGMSSTSDFVKKLYKMLDDPAIAHVVCWGPAGDCFVVKDMNEFTKSILPRMFKHSNFASFVRQLNKYDFHKVKNNDDTQFGEHSWTFRHPDFHADRPECLENIKRKVPTQRKSTGGSGLTKASDSPGPESSLPPAGAGTSSNPADHARLIDALQAQVDRLSADQEVQADRLREMHAKYEGVLAELVAFQRSQAGTDALIRNLLSYFLNLENGKTKEALAFAQANSSTSARLSPSGLPPASTTTATTTAATTKPPQSQATTAFSPDQNNPFLPATETQRLIGAHAAFQEGDVARATLMQLNEISRRAESAGMSFNLSGSGGPAARVIDGPSGAAAAAASSAGAAGPSTSSAGAGRPMDEKEALARLQELERIKAAAQQQQELAQGAGPQAAPAGGLGGAAQSAFLLPPDAAAEDPASSAANANAVAAAGAGGALASAGGLQVWTLGHLMPRSTVDDPNGNWTFDPASLGIGALQADAGMFEAPQPFTAGAVRFEGYAEQSVASSGAGGTATPANAAAGSDLSRPSSTLRVRRSAFVPGWAVPPRVLLVDDDAVNRKLSSKFLQVLGCTTDVAVDGVGAVNKMNLEKYDLVLMDIVMPKLDGVSATSLIRQFDHMTPIISMTSASKPNEIMRYYSHGMNDILPKPFTKEGLFDMLEKHLTHLKVIKQMSNIPRALSPGLDALMATGMGASSLPLLPLPPAGEGDGKINPLAGMGLSDEQYSVILHNIIANESFAGVSGVDMSMMGLGGMDKRVLEDPVADARETKRGRFEVVE